MKEMIKEMLGMQKVLDSAIYDGHGVEYDRSKTYLALIDEIGELNHELKAEWCWWKKTVKPLDNEKVLEELVDCWHFALSIYYHEYPNFDWVLSHSHYIYMYKLKLQEVYCLIINEFQDDLILDNMIALTEKLDFTMEDVYIAYKKKNEVNFNRLASGY